MVALSQEVPAVPAHPHRPPIVAVVVVLFASIAGWLAPAPAAAATDLRGFHLHSLWWESTGADMDRELDLVERAGANAVRVDVGWSSLEQGGKGTRTGWYLGKLDRFVAGAKARGLRVIATVGTTPCWASSAPESLKQGCEGEWWARGVDRYPPANPGDYADIVAWIAARYGDALGAIEIWNEPNLTRFLEGPDPAAAYAAMLKAAYPAVKAASPDLPVLGGVLGHADRPFLERLYRHGIKGHYDGLSFHPYNEWRDPLDRWHERWWAYTFLPGIEWMRDAQRAAGDDAPVWITEFGWSTCIGHSWCVGEAAQADYLVKAFALLDEKPYVRAGIAYNLRDNGGARGDLESNWGLVRRDFSEKPAFAAVVKALSAARPDPPAPPAAPGKPLTLALHVGPKGGLIARGRAPRRARLRVRVASCKRGKTRAVRLRSGRRGGYRKRLGPARRLRGCRVTVAARRKHRRIRAVRRVPARVRRR